jgi:6-phosphogluconate dehydrogenase
MERRQIGIVGMAVMGKNLALNIDDHGYSISIFNRTVATARQVAIDHPDHDIFVAETLHDFVSSLEKPRKIILMVKAGKAVDETIAGLIPYLETGDLLIDAGNSYYKDTISRQSELEKQGLRFIGMGVSGGEEGARNGPAIMPGGRRDAFELVKNVLEAISAKAEGEACCAYIGPDGAGHYVKMVHNGIEYGDLQIIGEAYQLMKAAAGMSDDAMAEVFARWNATDLNSYLIEITAEILAYKDADGSPLVERILDTAGQKGTGKWLSVNSLDLGIPVTLITEAVYARSLSALKNERIAASKVLKGPEAKFTGDRYAFVEELRQAVLASKIISYAQGFMLMREAQKEYGWKLAFGDIALLWRAGCIIRSAFLDRIKTAFDKRPDLGSLLLDEYFASVVGECQSAWRRVVSQAVLLGVPVPALSSALAFYDGYRSARLPANLLQAQRDYFGAHTYQRIDKPADRFFHTNWTGHGGETASGSYTA